MAEYTLSCSPIEHSRVRPQLLEPCRACLEDQSQVLRTPSYHLDRSLLVGKELVALTLASHFCIRSRKPSQLLWNWVLSGPVGAENVLLTD